MIAAVDSGLSDVRVAGMGSIAFRLLRGAAILVVLVMIGCRPLSIREESESAGFNGGFEIVESGLPVNWYFHYPPIKDRDVEISIDTTDAVEGRKSLRFVVHKADPAARGVRTAGLFQVLPAESLRTYRVNFWLKNRGCTMRLLIRSEKASEAPPPNIEILGEAETGTNTWRQFEYTYTVPETYGNIRFELNILQPGTLWIDGVRIESVPTDRSAAESS